MGLEEQCFFMDETGLCAKGHADCNGVRCPDFEPDRSGSVKIEDRVRARLRMLKDLNKLNAPQSIINKEIELVLRGLAELAGIPDRPDEEIK